jgi:hypothetical protein
LLELTVEVAKLFNITPFDVFEKEKNHVLMLIDYFLSKDSNGTAQPETYTPPQIENAGGYSDPIWNYL